MDNKVDAIIYGYVTIFAKQTLHNQKISCALRTNRTYCGK